MPLIDLKTNLKDLKFGHDQKNGGNSNQPFVPVNVPSSENPLTPDYFPKITIDDSPLFSALSSAIETGGNIFIGSSLKFLGQRQNDSNSNPSSPDLTSTVKIPELTPISGTGGTDFLIRGGLLVPSSVLRDGIRLVKFFTSTDGILFSIKQNILSAISVRPESQSGFGNFLNDKIYTPLSTILGAVGSPIGLHPNKQGLNPLRGIFNSESYTPNRYFGNIADDTKEIKTDIKKSNLNRLYGLYSIKLLGDNRGSAGRKNDISNNEHFLLSYLGGPGSILGIGRTRISYATDNVGNILSVNNTNINGYSLKTINTLSDATHNNNSQHIETAIVNTQYRKELANIQGDPGNPIGKLKGLNLRYRFREGYDNVNVSYGAASPNSYDKITALPIYRTSTTSDKDKNPNDYSDLVNFRIGVINNSDPTEIDYIHFRAFLNTITDNYDSSWNSVKYIGRGENFYTYSGFDRKLSLSWVVAAQSKIELIPMYKKLNYLASLTAPDYGSFGYMRANIVQLTIGGYLFEQKGIINRVNYEISEDSTWEIARTFSGLIDETVKQLHHMIKVNFDFTPIHDFVPRKQQNDYSTNDDDYGLITKYGDEHFIALDYNNTSSYGTSLDQDKKLYFNNLNPKPGADGGSVGGGTGTMGNDGDNKSTNSPATSDAAMTILSGTSNNINDSNGTGKVDKKVADVAQSTSQAKESEAQDINTNTVIFPSSEYNETISPSDRTNYNGGYSYKDENGKPILNKTTTNLDNNGNGSINSSDTYYPDIDPGTLDPLINNGDATINPGDDIIKD